MKKIIAPSLMCADQMHMGDHLKELEALGVSLLHVDIMDGEFVPNFTFGTDFIRQLHEQTRLPLDVHLMITRPARKLAYFPFLPGDYVSVHAETAEDLQGTAQMLRTRGVHPAIALNPATPLSVLEPVLDQLDMVLVMAVEPGFAGRKMVPGTLPKLREARTLLKEKAPNVLLETDGNVSFENAALMAQAGASVFVAGTSSLYAKTGSLQDNYRRLCRACGISPQETPED